MMPEAGKAVSLEVVEVELALGAQDIVADGFEGALQKAVELVDGKLIFNIRAPENSDYQRVAAISVSDGSAEQTVFVTLGNDGTTFAVTADKSDINVGSDLPLL
jgi:hypothetical protein